MAAGRSEELIGTVNPWQLNALPWPILRMVVPGFVAERELDHYVSGLLDTGLWSMVRVVRRPRVAGAAQHAVDLYGTPSLTREN